MSEYYTVEELAKLLKTTEYTIRKWLRDGELKGKKIGKFWYVSKEYIEKTLRVR